jgi:hypothetical protein
MDELRRRQVWRCRSPTGADVGGCRWWRGGFGGAAARLVAALFCHLAEAFELEALIVLSRGIELLGRSIGWRMVSW